MIYLDEAVRHALAQGAFAKGHFLNECPLILALFIFSEKENEQACWLQEILLRTGLLAVGGREKQPDKAEPFLKNAFIEQNQLCNGLI